MPITFVPGTVIPSTWLNDVDDITYVTVPALVTASNSHTTSISTLNSLITDRIKINPAFANQAINVYQESGETTRFAIQKIVSTDPGAHGGTEHSSVAISHIVTGSGVNGPADGDTVLTLSGIKDNYPSSGVTGEIDGVNVVLRNDVGDAGAYIANVQVAAGFGAFSESLTTQVPPGGGAVTKSVNVQIGTIDTPSTEAYGVVTQTTVGACTDAFRAQSTAPGTWTNLFQGVVGGVSVYTVKPTGIVDIIPLTSTYNLGSIVRLGHEGAVNVYTTLFNGSGVSAIRAGGTADQTNYYGNTTHAWSTASYGTQVMTLNVTDLNLQNGINFKQTSAANGAVMSQFIATELLTLSTSGLTTDTAANLLPANSIIDCVTTRITTTITTTTNWAVGDPTTSGRFSAANATLAAGTNQAGLLAMAGNVTTVAAGPTQAAAAKVRITCTGANPGAGVVRITVFGRTFTPPTS